MTHAGIRRGAALALAAVVPTLVGCYEYAPLPTAVAPAGHLVELEINDQGRAGLTDRFGPGVVGIEGRLVAQQGNELVLNIFRVSQLSGEKSQWAGETTRLDRGYVSTIKGRQFSASRTSLVALAGAAVIGFAIFNHGLLGSFSGPTSEPPPVDPPAKIRIPARP
jgi:hypothetical protein